MRRAMVLVGVLACSRPIVTAPQPAARPTPELIATHDAGPCTEPDGDGDGVVDVCDACPDDRGERPDGCPRDVVVETSEIRVTSPIFFSANSATVTPPGRPVLDEIAAVMRQHPELLRVEVGGHASVGERGPAALAQQRAEAVRAYLTERGVESARLVTRGYGVDRPLDPRATAIARERNRRVEFHILDTARPSRPSERPRQVVPAGCPDAPPPRVGPCGASPR